MAARPLARGLPLAGAERGAENVLAFARRTEDGKRWVVVACNFSPVVREGWRIGLPRARGGGAEHGLALLRRRRRRQRARDREREDAWNEQKQSAEITLPPLGVVWLVPGAPSAA